MKKVLLFAAITLCFLLPIFTSFVAADDGDVVFVGGEGENHFATLLEAAEALPAEGGTIAFDPQPTLGDGQFYPRNTTVTITATPAAGRRFVRWYGDVDESVCSNATISVTMDGELRLIAYFDTPWVVAEGNESMSDGYWTIPVSGYPDAMKLGADKLGGTTYPDARMPMELDLAKPIVGGGTITSLSDFFVGFQNNDYRLRRVVLPGTL